MHFIFVKSNARQTHTAAYLTQRARRGKTACTEREKKKQNITEYEYMR
jgi:hypothetical protein